MYQIMITLLIFLAGVLTSVSAQSKYETEMQKALTEFHEAESSDAMEKAAQHFDRISKVESENWLPAYYAIFIRALEAFSMDKQDAIKKADELESLCSNLENMNPDQSEVLTLRGLIRTVKVAKDPQTFGMTLSSAIIKDYEDALKLNPKNPRAMYLMAQYNMGGAQFWGKDPKSYCPQVESSKKLILEEKQEGFKPHWGEQQIDEILETTCKQ